MTLTIFLSKKGMVRHKMLICLSIDLPLPSFQIQLRAYFFRDSFPLLALIFSSGIGTNSILIKFLKAWSSLYNDDNRLYILFPFKLVYNSFRQNFDKICCRSNGNLLNESFSVGKTLCDFREFCRRAHCFANGKRTINLIYRNHIKE